MPLNEKPVKNPFCKETRLGSLARRRGPKEIIPPSLSIRLTMVSQLLPAGKRLIDIGTDHAYLPIKAVMDGLFPTAVAADIRPGPIAVAERNIRRYTCTGKVQAALSDGLAAFSLQDDDVVVMAGLGGLEMIDILTRASSLWPRLVLQPQKSAPALRHFLALHRYAIRKEALCMENNRLYLCLVAEQTGSEISDDLADHFIGPILRREKPPLFQDWLEKQRIQVVHAIKRGEPLDTVLKTIDELLRENQQERGEIV